MQCSIDLTSPTHRKKEQLQRKRSRKSNPKLRLQNLPNKNGKKPRRQNGRPRRRLQSKPERRLQIYSSPCKCRECLLVLIPRPSFANSIKMEIVKKVVISGEIIYVKKKKLSRYQERNASLPTTYLSRGRRRRKTSIQMPVVVMLRARRIRRTTTWTIGTRKSFVRSSHPSTATRRQLQISYASTLLRP